MHEAWLKELNKRNGLLLGEDPSKWIFATVSVYASVLTKLSLEAKAKLKSLNSNEQLMKLSIGQG